MLLIVVFFEKFLKKMNLKYLIIAALSDNSIRPPKEISYMVRKEYSEILSAINRLIAEKLILCEFFTKKQNTIV